MLDSRQRGPTNAERELKEALQLDPESAAAKFVLGNIYWIQRQLKEAANFSARWPNLHRCDRSGVSVMSISSAKPASSGASKSLAEITAKAPDYLPAWIDLMNLACTNGQHHDCTDIIEQILLHDPDQALLARADLKITEGKVLEARIEFDRLRTSYLI